MTWHLPRISSTWRVFSSESLPRTPAAYRLMALSMVVKVSCGLPSGVRSFDMTQNWAASQTAQNHSWPSFWSTCHGVEIKLADEQSHVGFTVCENALKTILLQFNMVFITLFYNQWAMTLNTLQYSKTSLNRPTIGLTLNDPFMEVVSLELEYHYGRSHLGPK